MLDFHRHPAGAAILARQQQTMARVVQAIIPIFENFVPVIERELEAAGIEPRP
jgi:hypothetical protein